MMGSDGWQGSVGVNTPPAPSVGTLNPQTLAGGKTTQLSPAGSHTGATLWRKLTTPSVKSKGIEGSKFGGPSGWSVILTSKATKIGVAPAGAGAKRANAKTRASPGA